MARENLPEHTKGSGNVFADIGIPEPEEHLVKAQLVSELQRVIKTRKMTQTNAAKLLGLSQPELSKMLRGHFRGYSVERLIRFLTVFERDVDIVVKAKRKGGKPGQVSVISA